MIKNAVITGAGGGLGFALVKLFLSEGYRVAALDLNITDALSVLSKENENVIPIKADISREEDVSLAAKEIRESFESVEVLINAAAVWLDFERIPLEDSRFDIEMCRREFNINAMGPLIVTKKILPLMRKSSAPEAIINLSSDCASYNPEEWRVAEYAYSMSKAALTVMTSIIKNAVANTPMNVFAVFPGWMRTKMGFMGVQEEGKEPDVTPEEAAACILSLIRSPKRIYVFCDRFGNEMK